MQLIEYGLSAGSSPRVRGKPQTRIDLREISRLIPARAGKTLPRDDMHARRAAHPRACGENVREVSLTAIPAGSSPRVRGKPPRLGAAATEAGLIPARAGKTLDLEGAVGGRGPHPRACGENAPVRTE